MRSVFLDALSIRIQCNLSLYTIILRLYKDSLNVFGGLSIIQQLSEYNLTKIGENSYMNAKWHK